MPGKPKVPSYNGTWKGRGVYATGRKVVIPCELDDDATKLVLVSVPLSKVDTLVASLYRARKVGMEDVERWKHPPTETPEPAHFAPPAGMSADFLSWLAEQAREYEKRGDQE